MRERTGSKKEEGKSLITLQSCSGEGRRKASGTRTLRVRVVNQFTNFSCDRGLHCNSDCKLPPTLPWQTATYQGQILMPWPVAFPLPAARSRSFHFSPASIVLLRLHWIALHPGSANTLGLCSVFQAFVFYSKHTHTNFPTSNEIQTYCKSFPFCTPQYTSADTFNPSHINKSHLNRGRNSTGCFISLLYVTLQKLRPWLAR